MKLSLLAECVSRLNKCDIDNIDDQKTISVCENYLLESYKEYEENCYYNDIEPLNESEYIGTLLLNEGFFKKLLIGAGAAAALGGAAVAGKKTFNAVNSNALAQGNEVGGIKNFANNFSNFRNQSGGMFKAAGNIAKTSMNKDTAGQQYAAAKQTTNYNADTKKGNSTLEIQNRKDAKDAIANNNAAEMGQRKGTLNVTRKNAAGEDVTRSGASNISANEIKQKQQAAAERKQQIILQRQEEQAEKESNSDPVNQSLQQSQQPVAKKNSAPVQTNQTPQPVQPQQPIHNESFIAANLKQPLTPAIKMPARYYD